MTTTPGPRKAAAPAPVPRLPRAVRAAIDAALAKKAMDVVVLDLRKAGAFTDYFVIATGANPRQVQAIADAVRESLKALQVRPAHTEGYERAEWVLLDCFDFVIHVFSPAARAFYGLDRLWGSAKRIEIEER
jgi:ribosome-associated protein